MSSMEERIAEAKKFLKKAIADGMLCTRRVSACTYHGKKSGDDYIQGAQQCHIHLNRVKEIREFKPLFMMDNIQKDDGWLASEEKRVAYLQYFMDHPIFSQSFLEHDAKKAIHEGMMVRDLTRLPSNALAYAVIATRAMWEYTERNLCGRFFDLLQSGFSPDWAYLMSNFYKKGRTCLSFEMADTSLCHIAFPCTLVDEEWITNYLNYNMVGAAPGTIVQKVPYYFSPGYGEKAVLHKHWNVFSLFTEDLKEAYFNDPKLPWAKEALPLGSGIKVDSIKNLEASFR